MNSVAQIKNLELKIAEHERQLQDLKAQLTVLKSTCQDDVLESLIEKSSTAETLADSHTGSLSSWPLALEEYQRYGRHMILPEMGLQGQLRLRSASILIVGLGGLGCPAAAYLAGAGVGTLGLVDGDTVETSNLHRQILHTTSRVGMLKVESAKVALEELNPYPSYRLHPSHLSPTTALEIFSKYDLILDCTDHPTSRYLISDAAVLAGKPLISASALRTEGQLLVLNHPSTQPLSQRASSAKISEEVPSSSVSGPCYRCVFPRAPPPESVISCGEGGILGPVVGVMGVLMALEAIKVVASPTNALALLNAPTSLPTAHAIDLTSEPPAKPTMLLFSAFSGTPFRSIRLRGKRSDCASCGVKPSITADALRGGSLDYAVFCGVLDPVSILAEGERVSAAEFGRVHRRHSMAEGDANENGQDGKGLRMVESENQDERKSSGKGESEGGRAVLIDVRDATQFGIANLPGSVNLPWSILQNLRPPAPAPTPTPCHAPSADDTSTSNIHAPIKDHIAGLEPAGPSASIERARNDAQQDASDSDPLAALRRHLRGARDVYAICRFGNDSQLAVRKLQELGFGGERGEHSGGGKSMGGERSGTNGGKGGDEDRKGKDDEGGRVRIRDVRGGFESWRRDVDSAWPEY